MNVLHVHSGNMFGGVERMLETLSPATAARTPIESAFALCFDGDVGTRLRAAGADVHVLGPVHARQLTEIRHARRALSSVLQMKSWDAVLVHSSWSQAIFGPTILNSQVPLVRWLHAPAPGPRVLEFWARRSRPALVLCNSEYTRRAAGKRFGSGPLSVVYPPSVYIPAGSNTRADVRASIGAAPDAVAIVIAARMEPWKGHADLVSALSSLSSSLSSSNWEAWIAGGPQRPAERPYFDSLMTQVRSANLTSRVRFLGERSDVSQLLQAADIYCQPNIGAEPFGLAFVEALSAGLPVVTTRLGAAPEIIDDSCGVLVEPGSPGQLRDVLSRLIDDAVHRTSLSAGARQRARAFCDLPRSLNSLAAELRQVSAPAAAPALQLT